MSKAIFTIQMERYLERNRNLDLSKITSKINKKFETNFSEHSIRLRLKKRVLFPLEVLEFMVKHYKKASGSQLAAMIEKEFGLTIDPSTVSHRLLVLGIRKSSNGWKEYNEAKASGVGFKGIQHRNKKAGDTVLIKSCSTLRTKKEDGSYIRTAQYNWELVNGPMPDGMSIVHMDGDRMNNDISNLSMVPKGVARSFRIHFKDFGLRLGQTKLYLYQIKSKIREVSNA